MKNLKQIILVFLLAAVTLLSAGCTKDDAAGQSSGSPTKSAGTNAAGSEKQEAVSLIISAAASLTDVMEEIKGLYSKDKSNVTLEFTFASSGSLQQQIEQGAPADIFFSAATKQMDALKSKDLLINDTIVNLLENKVVLITPKDSALVTGFNDLADSKVKQVALGEPQSVPVGQYAEEIINYLGIKDAVQPKSIYGKDVRTVLTWVETGNAEVGIVYATDAKISDKVKVVAAAPENSCSPVIYPAAVVKSTKNAEAAKEFLKYLSGDKAKAVFEKYGFTVLK